MCVNINTFTNLVLVIAGFLIEKKKNIPVANALALRKLNLAKPKVIFTSIRFMHMTNTDL